MLTKLLVFGVVVVGAWWVIGRPTSIPELQADIKKITDQITPSADASSGGDDDDAGGGAAGGHDHNHGGLPENYHFFTPQELQDLQNGGQDNDDDGGDQGSQDDDNGGAGAADTDGGQDTGDTGGGGHDHGGGQDDGSGANQRPDGRPSGSPTDAAPTLGGKHDHGAGGAGKGYRRGWYTVPGHHHCDPDEQQPHGVRCCCTDKSKCKVGTCGAAIHHAPHAVAKTHHNIHGHNQNHHHPTAHHKNTHHHAEHLINNQKVIHPHHIKPNKNAFHLGPKQGLHPGQIAQVTFDDPRKKHHSNYAYSYYGGYW